MNQEICKQEGVILSIAHTFIRVRVMHCLPSLGLGLYTADFH